MKATFFEQLGAADVERIHSQMLAWIFSSDFEGFKDEKSKLKLIKNIFDVDVSHINYTLAESDKIDLQIDCPEALLIIENKLKTSQHSNQLVRYREDALKKYPDRTIECFFLTLCEELSFDKHWSNINYTGILGAFEELHSDDGICENFHGMILLDYMETIRKFTDVIVVFINNTEKFGRVFLDGKSAKKAKLANGIGESQHEKFIRKNQLETILQMYYFQKVRSHLRNPEEYYIVETRGNAILGRHIVREVVINGKSYHLGMDFQDGSFKTMLIAADYYNSSNLDFTEEVYNIYKELLTHSDNKGYEFFNKPRSRAQISLTNRKFKSESWWDFSPKEFAIKFQEEVDNVECLIKNDLLPKFSSPTHSEVVR